ncbi:glycosyltransferase family 2 protein [Peribacillus simplex]|uniref:glycosyltransferase family 2 protein n=1 Tax=Peribacillus simplex TaxID=1478 RepID=UPI000BA7253E|nr:glycosyltransferase family 2 protein [Peribacillus simplex]PAL14207.1 hypothetical protein B8W99_07340 [Peribacillus simplex]
MILGSIITYNPDINLLFDNIEAVINQVDKVIIIENDSNNKTEVITQIKKKYENIEIIVNPQNVGVAGALNQALSYAESNNFKWLLSLDQDSVCEEKFIYKYKNYLRECNTKEILLLCPNIVDINVKNKNLVNDNIEEVDMAITSGSFLNVENSMKIGGFLNELFIDYVDFEFCLRGRGLNLKIFKLNNVNLYHRLGDIKEKNFLKYKIIVTNHSPFRRYYLYRNKIFIYKRYFNKNRRWVMRNIFSSFKTFFIIILYEDYKAENLKNIFRGIKDGLYLQEK